MRSHSRYIAVLASTRRFAGGMLAMTKTTKTA
jgi:hypothetical protein